ncbi:hypothetical protein L6259_02625 [Candidatus Parcubacteria bacterium]|nr:hypothetical protein [Patescibacteria group bacterium]MCG2694140.1 hypothetical protein [Candidatus Parcubacteria bacterium]
MASLIELPSAWEMAKEIWPWFWGINKIFWPIWIVIGIFILFKIFSRRLEVFIDNKKRESKMKKCPDCAKWVPKEAKKCAYCSKIL